LSALVIDTAEVFEPLLYPSRYKAAWGGRGSGKSHFFAGALVEDHFRNPGMRSVCIREVQKSLKDSAKKLIEDKIASFGLGQSDGFECLEYETRTPGGGLIIYQGMQDHTAESIKSLEGFDRAWVEEAQSLSATSLKLLRPTIRSPASELWFSWNPRRKSDPVDALFQAKPPTNAIAVRANWDSNPWFPAELEQERLDCLRDEPDQYDHIWEGCYVSVAEGAYFAKQLAEAKKRIAFVAPDPLMEYRAFWDIGTRDATAIWVAQFVGREIRVLDYYEAVGQPLAAHLGWLRERGYGSALCVLPHDGERSDHLTADKFADHIQAAGFRTQTVKNQGKGAAMKRVEAARRLFPSIWFNAETTEAGRDALGWYHEKRDEARNIGLGPEHDWASHGADAFGLMCVAYEEPNEKRKVKRPDYAGPGGWMG
jgi:phage terminase large subunit